VRYLFRAEDAAGNVSIDDAGGACHALRARVLFCSVDDDVEPVPQPGWQPEGRWRVAESGLARSPTRVWIVDGDGRRTDSSLVLPHLVGVESAILEFWHSFELDVGRAGAVVEVSRDGAMWTDLGPSIIEGGYSFIAHGAPSRAGPPGPVGSSGL
jgi:hypothetical protein